jgi:hypothetical protein
VLIDPTGVFTAQRDFSGVVTEQNVVLFGRHNPWACLSLRLRPAAFCEALEDFIQQKPDCMFGGAFFGEIHQ